MSKAIASAVALAGFIVTTEQAIMAQMIKNRIAIYERHQKAPKPSKTLHVGAIYTLGSLVDEMSGLRRAIANELAVTASSYASRVTYPADSDSEDSNVLAGSDPRLSPEAPAALEVIGDSRS